MANSIMNELTQKPAKEVTTVDNEKFAMQLVPTQVEEFTKKLAHINWINARDTPWSDCVRDVTKQAKPETRVQGNYHKNNIEARKIFLDICKDIVCKKITSPAQLKERISEMHKVLILGTASDSIYMNPDQKIKVSGKSPEEVAGNYGIFQEDQPFERLLANLQSFLDPENFKNKSQQELALQAGHIYLKDLNGFITFGYGNNSLYMNMTNAMLRMIGLNGIQHEWLDITFLCGSSANKFDSIFLEHVEKTNPSFLDTNENSKSIIGT